MNFNTGDVILLGIIAVFIMMFAMMILNIGANTANRPMTKQQQELLGLVIIAIILAFIFGS